MNNNRSPLLGKKKKNNISYPNCMDDINYRKQQFPQLYNINNNNNNYNDKTRNNNNMTYLDHAGATIPSIQQLEKHFLDIKMNIYGNPHSNGPASGPANVKVDAIRHQVLKLFNVDSSTHSVIFTSGATHALKIVGEYFPWMVNDTYCHSIECHTSMLGIREYALDKRSNEENFSIIDVAKKYKECIERTNNRSSPLSINNRKKILFAFPAECNFSGFQPNMDFLKENNNDNNTDEEEEQRNNNKWNNKKKQKVFVLLDAAKFAATSPLDLNVLTNVDFVSISFYKIFGFPTGLGALIVKNKSAHILGKCKKYFGGGTVSVVMATTVTTNDSSSMLSINASKNSVQYRHKLKDNISERFEDGTLNFQGILSVNNGLEQIMLLGGMDNINRHVKHLTATCYIQMTNLIHVKTSKPLCQFYGYYYDRLYGSVGSIIAFNLLDSNGDPIGYSHVEKLASLANIQLRTGCFCNPGACQKFLNISANEVDYNYRTGNKVCGDDNDLMEVRSDEDDEMSDDIDHVINNKPKVKKPIGAIRISFGYMSNMSDVLHFVKFLKVNFIDKNDNNNNNNNNNRTVEEEKEYKANNTNTSKSKVPVKATSTISFKKQIKINNLEIKDAEKDVKAHVKRMYVYPIKSCGGFEVPSGRTWPVVSNKLYLDRQWALVTPKASLDGKLTWRVLHCKRDISMAKIGIEVCLGNKEGEKDISVPMPLAKNIVSDENSNEKVHLCINAPGMKTLHCELPVKPSTNHNNNNNKKDRISNLSQIMVCGEKCQGIIDMTPSNELEVVNKWFSEYFGFACRLIHVDNLKERKKKDIGWSNSGQVLLINTTSVDHFQKRLSDKIHLYSNDKLLLERRFRPNIVIDAVDSKNPHVEDTWDGYLQACAMKQIGETNDHSTLERPSFYIHGPCSRCRMININPDTGVENNEYLQILNKYRGKRSATYFGILLTIRNGLEPVTFLKCGDELCTF